LVGLASRPTSRCLGSSWEPASVCPQGSGVGGGVLASGQGPGPPGKASPPAAWAPFPPILAGPTVSRGRAAAQELEAPGRVAESGRAAPPNTAPARTNTAGAAPRGRRVETRPGDGASSRPPHKCVDGDLFHPAVSVSSAARSLSASVGSDSEVPGLGPGASWISAGRDTLLLYGALPSCETWDNEVPGGHHFPSRR